MSWSGVGRESSNTPGGGVPPRRCTALEIHTVVARMAAPRFKRLPPFTVSCRQGRPLPHRQGGCGGQQCWGPTASVTRQPSGADRLSPPPPPTPLRDTTPFLPGRPHQHFALRVRKSLLSAGGGHTPARAVASVGRAGMGGGHCRPLPAPALTAGSPNPPVGGSGGGVAHLPPAACTRQPAGGALFPFPRQKTGHVRSRSQHTRVPATLAPFFFSPFACFSCVFGT